MPELNVAPSPSPVVAAVEPAAAKASPSPSDGAAAGSSESQPATPFAAVLQHQMAQPADAKAAKAAKAVDALLAAAAAATDATANATAAAPDATASAKDDALAFLAPMLPGIARATTGDDDGKSAKKDDGETTPAATVIAAPLAIAVVASNAAAATQATAESARSATATDPQPKSPAILAAENAAVAEVSADSGKGRNAQQTGFDALLNASREASATAANNAAAHASHGVAAQAAPVAVSAPVATPVGAPGWDREVGEKIVWMAGRLDSRAELVLNPPNMGRIEVSLSINGDQANAAFVSTNPAVREALENAVPRLREILQDAGISLGQAQVGAESFQQSANNRENGDNASRGGSNARTADSAMPNGLIAGGSTSAQWLRRGNGLVDTFA